MAIERLIEEMNKNISSIAQTITGQVGKTIKGEIRTVKDSVKDESLRVINYGIKRDIQEIKGEVQAIKLDLLTVKQSVKDEIQLIRAELKEELSSIKELLKNVVNKW